MRDARKYLISGNSSRRFLGSLKKARKIENSQSAEGVRNLSIYVAVDAPVLHDWKRGVTEDMKGCYVCSRCDSWTANLPLYKNDPCYYEKNVAAKELAAARRDNARLLAEQLETAEAIGRYQDEIVTLREALSKKFAPPLGNAFSLAAGWWKKKGVHLDPDPETLDWAEKRGQLAQDAFMDGYESRGRFFPRKSK